MPYTEGTTLKGWGVVRGAPWHFVGLYETKEQAESVARQSGPDYQVKYGENQAGTDNFVWSSNDNPN